MKCRFPESFQAALPSPFQTHDARAHGLQNGSVRRICWRVVPLYEDVQLMHSKVKGLSASTEDEGDWKVE